MMTDFQIRFDPTPRGLDMRPPGATEFLDALSDFANDDSEEFTTRDAADAHNYICALETQVLNLYRQVLRNQYAVKRADQVMEFYTDNSDLLKLPPLPPLDPKIFTELGIPPTLLGIVPQNPPNGPCPPGVRAHDPNEPSYEIETRPGAL